MIKETREQYLARRQAQLEKRLAWQKRRNERIAERKKQAMEEAMNAYNSTQHIRGKDLKSIMSTELVKRCLDEFVYGTRNKDFEALFKELFRRTSKRAKKDGYNYQPPNTDNNCWLNFLKKEDITSTYQILCGRTTPTFKEDYEFLCSVFDNTREWSKSLERDEHGSIKQMTDWPEDVIASIKSYKAKNWNDIELKIAPVEPNEERFWENFSEDTKMARSFFNMLRKKYILDWEEIMCKHLFYSPVAL